MTGIHYDCCGNIFQSLILNFILPFRDEEYPPVVWTTMFMSGQVLMNFEDLVIAPYSYTRIKANLLYLFINVVTRNLSVSICGNLILDGNSKGYDEDEHISTEVEVNPPMLSMLKNSTYV